MARVIEESTEKQNKTNTYFGEVDIRNVEENLTSFLSRKYRYNENSERLVDENDNTIVDYSLNINLKEYLQKKFSLNNNQALEDFFGNKWKLCFEEESPEEPDNTNNILIVSIKEYLIYINDNIEPIQRKANTVLNNIVKGKSVRKSSMNAVKKYLTHPNMVKVFTNQKYEEIPSQIIETWFHSMVSSNQTDVYLNVSPKIKNQVIEGLELLINIQYKIVADRFRLLTKEGMPLTQGEAIVQEFIKLFYRLLFPTYIQIKSKIKYKQELFNVTRNKETDLVLIDNFGAPTILEIKLPDAEMFIFDSSHKKIAPNDNFSKAISQLADYIFGFAHGEFHSETSFHKEFSALSNGILLIGSLDSSKIMSSPNMKKALAYYGDKTKLRKAYETELLILRKLYSNIKVITFDQLKFFLENSIN